MLKYVLSGGWTLRARRRKHIRPATRQPTFSGGYNNMQISVAYLSPPHFPFQSVLQIYSSRPPPLARLLSMGPSTPHPPPTSRNSRTADDVISSAAVSAETVKEWRKGVGARAGRLTEGLVDFDLCSLAFGEFLRVPPDHYRGNCFCSRVPRLFCYPHATDFVSSTECSPPPNYQVTAAITTTEPRVVIYEHPYTTRTSCVTRVTCVGPPGSFAVSLPR